MKRKVALFVAVVLCVSLAGCIALEDTPSKEISGKENDGQSGGKTSTTKEELVFGLNETAVFSDLKFTANELKEDNGTEFFTPEEGNTFVGVRFTIENTSDEEQTVSSLLMFEGYVDDVKCDYSFNAACAFDEGTLDGAIAAGKKLVGWYALEVPEDWTSIELHVQDDWLSNSTAKFVFEK